MFSAGGENRYHSFSQFDMHDPNRAGRVQLAATCPSA